MRVKTKPTKSLSVHPHAILLVISEPQMNLYLESHSFFKRKHHRKVHFGLSLISIDKLLLFTVKNLPWEYYHPILQKWVYHAFQWEKVNSFRFRNLVKPLDFQKIHQTWRSWQGFHPDLKISKNLAFSPVLFIWTFQVRRKPLDEATANSTDSRSDSYNRVKLNRTCTSRKYVTLKTSMC